MEGAVDDAEATRESVIREQVLRTGADQEHGLEDFCCVLLRSAAPCDSQDIRGDSA
jgi:hypothetical protein